MNLTVIIRSVGERTEQELKRLIIKQGITESNVRIIREIPFSKAMKVSFETGIEMNNRWTFCLDADVLVRQGALKKMYTYAEAAKPDVIRVQGFVLDKFFGGSRLAGNHLYRTAYLEDLIKCIPDEGTDIRPETRALGEARKLGYQTKHVPYIIGLHDFEQYARDIYRKIFIHGVKHVNKTPLFIHRWKKNIKDDIDYEIALHALAESIKYTGELFINSEQNIYHEKFEESGFQEKEDLTFSSLSTEEIEGLIVNWDEDEMYLRFFPDKDGYDRHYNAALHKFRKGMSGGDFWNSLGHSVGAALIKTGKSIQMKIK